jgi:ribose transport system substrate-binding protein
MDGIVLQDPVRMAELSVTTIADHIRGKKVEPHVGTGETLATPENMNDPAVQKLLKPELVE